MWGQSILYMILLLKALLKFKLFQKERQRQYKTGGGVRATVGASIIAKWLVKPLSVRQASCVHTGLRSGCSTLDPASC